MLMLYIIGIAHRAQARKPDGKLTDEQQAFASCLRHAIEKTHPAFIGEEDNEEFLLKRAEISISKEIAEENDNIEHRFCDPNTEERLLIGYKNFMSVSLELWMVEPELSNDELTCKARAIEISRYFPIRERFWLERLKGFGDVNSVSVCGDIHIESFGALLESEGIPHAVVQRGIGVNEKDEPYYQASEYLKVHPDLASE